ncbi:hypothetical protein [Streptomyces sp. SID14515]|uniref:hypothetical protein n=1 Tax=Streptomyces sp. SID14515 TaxID=2706074 RepID=UPI001EF2F868|nr:hypothetical protein [Streptomyces sp. SID14515]
MNTEVFSGTSARQQTFEEVRGSDTVRARLTVDAAYGSGSGSGEDRRTAVAEIEFFGRRE